MDSNAEYGWSHFRVQSLRTLIEWTGADGHSILGFPPEDRLEDMGWNAREGMIFGTHIQSHKSDTSSPKSTIYADGGAVESVRGFYVLDLLWSIARGIDADTENAASKMGRGFQAQALFQAIASRLDEIANMVTQEDGKSRPDLGVRLRISHIVEEVVNV